MTATSGKCISVNNQTLATVRFWFYGLNLVTLLLTALRLLQILDFSVEEDPAVRAYEWIQWNLLSIWCNLIFLLYLPLCMYMDWGEKNGDEIPNIDLLRQIRDMTMAAILVPITFYCDGFFWILYTWFPSSISPVRLLEMTPSWSQQVMHTGSFVFIILDLVLTPRRRPESHKTNLTVLYIFSIIYVLDMFVNYQYGYIVYAFLGTASYTLLICSVIGSFTSIYVFYYAQWYIVDYVWSEKSLGLRTESVKRD